MVSKTLKHPVEPADSIVNEEGLSDTNSTRSGNQQVIQHPVLIFNQINTVLELILFTINN